MQFPATKSHVVTDFDSDFDNIGGRKYPHLPVDIMDRTLEE